MRTSPALSFLALSTLLLAASAAANDYAGGNGAQAGQQWRPAYQKPVDGLNAEYYHKSCPDMEGIVQRAVKKAFAADYTVAAGLIRLFFHDFAVRGCDGSILIDAKGSEKYAAASKTLRGFKLIEDIKTELEAKCPKTVSCADILAAAARDASTEVGVDYWQLKYGRKDGRESRAEEADRYVPMGRENITDLINFFASRGLNVLDLVVLSGAHTIGHATCGAVKPRLCNYQGSGKPNVTLDHRYADFLRRKCHRGDGVYVELDGETPTEFDNRYYKNLMHGMGLLETDQKMLRDSRTGYFVRYMANQDQPDHLKHLFATSMRRLGDVQVLTGDEGEVRLKCSAVNY